MNICLCACPEGFSCLCEHRKYPYLCASALLCPNHQGVYFSVLPEGKGGCLALWLWLWLWLWGSTPREEKHWYRIVVVLVGITKFLSSGIPLRMEESSHRLEKVHESENSTDPSKGINYDESEFKKLADLVSLPVCVHVYVCVHVFSECMLR